MTCAKKAKKRPLSEAADSKYPVKISNFNLSKGNILVNERSDVRLPNSNDIGFKHNPNLARGAIVQLKEIEPLARGKF